MYKSNRSFNIPPLATSRAAFEFVETFCSNPPSPGQKAVQMPHHRSISGDQMAPPRYVYGLLPPFSDANFVALKCRPGAISMRFYSDLFPR